MEWHNEDLNPQRNSVILISIIIGFLFIITAGFLLFAVSYYQDKINTVSMKESRFLTTEWHILQAIKAETDRQLKEKDQEIAALRRQYRDLVQKNADPRRLHELENQMQEAIKKREEIVAQGFEVNQEDIISTNAGTDIESEASEEVKLKSVETQMAIRPSSALTELLKQEVKTLEEKLTASRSKNKTLEEELSEVRVNDVRTMVENRRRIDELANRLRQSEEAMKVAIEEMRRMEQDSQMAKSPPIEDLNTRALLQAIVNSPQIRTIYPDLGESVDRYLDTYALYHRMKGRKEASAEALEALEAMEAIVNKTDIE